MTDNRNIKCVYRVNIAKSSRSHGSRYEAIVRTAANSLIKTIRRLELNISYIPHTLQKS